MTHATIRQLVFFLLVGLPSSTGGYGPTPTAGPDPRTRFGSSTTPHPKPVVSGTITVTAGGDDYEVAADEFMRVNMVLGTRLDNNHDGILQGMKEGVAAITASNTDSDEALNTFELANSPFAEWTRHFIPDANGLVSYAQLETLLDKFDFDGDGQITVNEIIAFNTKYPDDLGI